MVVVVDREVCQQLAQVPEAIHPAELSSSSRCQQDIPADCVQALHMEVGLKRFPEQSGSEAPEVYLPAMEPFTSAKEPAPPRVMIGGDHESAARPQDHAPAGNGAGALLRRKMLETLTTHDSVEGAFLQWHAADVGCNEVDLRALARAELQRGNREVRGYQLPAPRGESPGQPAGPAPGLEEDLFPAEVERFQDGRDLQRSEQAKPQHPVVSLSVLIPPPVFAPFQPLSAPIARQPSRQKVDDSFASCEARAALLAHQGARIPGYCQRGVAVAWTGKEFKR
jgi:hypothetical protein